MELKSSLPKSNENVSTTGASNKRKLVVAASLGMVCASVAIFSWHNNLASDMTSVSTPAGLRMHPEIRTLTANSGIRVFSYNDNFYF